jgi:hypothetical protein
VPKIVYYFPLYI